MLQVDLVCFSHLRWNFVYQRPQHLLSRCARERRVFFVEEPLRNGAEAWLEININDDGVYLAVPHIPDGISDVETVAILRDLIDRMFESQKLDTYVLWYYTPMALAFSRHLSPQAIIYDCMDELSLFRDAPPALRAYENELFERADLVFTGGTSLYEAKRARHPHVHCFPSSVDVAHFARALQDLPDPADQASIPHPRLGFFGVIDERLDRDLLGGIAAARPDWHFILIGPVVKIDPGTLPQGPNLHYLGGKAYRDLPAYLAGWDVALMPFAHNDSTRFISPTKTPEYLAAGKPVVSTSIRDVVRPYGQLGLVGIADDAETFVFAAESAMNEDSVERQSRVDAFLADISWDRTWGEMSRLIQQVVDQREQSSLPQPLEHHAWLYRSDFSWEKHHV